MVDVKDIARGLRDKVSAFEADYKSSDTGKIIYCGDGIVRISGLAAVRYDELLLIEGGFHAIALNLEKNEVGAVLLEDSDEIGCGDTVYSTGKTVSVKVGDALLGRVVSPLGEPMDGLGEIRSDRVRPVESPAPAIMDRGKVDSPIETGILAVDSMIPIGRGQRELIIGDRQTGKTAIALDAVLNQKGKDVYCVYVSIGQKASTVAALIDVLRESGALEYTAVVCSTAKDPAPLQYLAPYAGCAIAEEWMYAGKDVLIVYDDLTKHAVAYRAMSLLLRRPAGREAYPGDVFYLHSRLLERAAKLSAARGGGSMTALPIVETQAGDISAYIPTNVISITDGQIYLESELFNSGMRPALNVGLSVSRVGGAAQRPAVRSVSGKLRIELAQYRELAVFSQFGSELDKSTQDILSRGAKLMETLKQPRYLHYTAEEMVLLLHVVSSSVADEIPLPRVREFESGFLEYVRSSRPEILGKMREREKMTEDLEREADALAADYAAYFRKEQA